MWAAQQSQPGSDNAGMLKSDLAEMVLFGDLYKLEHGQFSSRKQRDKLVASAIESVKILQKHGGFSHGEAKLGEVHQALRKLLVTA